ncbi:hypothetical protein HNQ80_003084 [Anaerosolibacter carboniphilus]|uniref:Uncharacterized protein n=2 Tax=Anaerosolibacter carboniphilus TaxID=1417629 RepID=A0A841L3M0_9FIRM|nr:hypothetical protein [Anaerosolibacter carboniphilus]
MMYTKYLLNVLMMLFGVSMLGYLLCVLKEKYYLKNNRIVLDGKGITEEHINEIDTNYFRVGKIEIMAGDEVKIYFNNKSKLRGIILGAKIRENSLMIITENDTVELVELKNIRSFKVINKYGKLFNWF